MSNAEMKAMAEHRGIHVYIADAPYTEANLFSPDSINATKKQVCVCALKIHTHVHMYVCVCVRLCACVCACVCENICMLDR